MGWARLDDGFHDHPKVDNLTLAAVGLYTLCLTWAHRHRKTATVQGHITEARVRKLAGRTAESLSTELLTSGLWEPEHGLGGYLIHDFEDYLPKERDPDERREAGKRGAATRWQGHGKPDSKGDGKLPSDSKANGVASDSSRAAAPAFPTRPDPGPVPESPTDSPGPRKRARQIPDDWKPTEADVTWQRGEGVPDLVARRELPRFQDHWRSKGEPRADWSATWRNWLRRAEDYSPRPAAGRDIDVATGKVKGPGWEFGM